MATAILFIRSVAIRTQAILSALSGAAFLLTFGTSTLYARDDVNYWASVTLEHPLNNKVRIIWNPLWRVRDDVSESFYLASRQGVGYKVSKSLDLAASYFYAEEKNIAGRWVPENRLELQTTCKWGLWDLKWSDRNRFEYRSVDDKEKWRYRNALKIAKPVKVWGSEFSPYVSDEIFYDFKKDELNQNRVSVGVTKKLIENVTLDVYYMVKSDKTGRDWNETQILGTSLTVVF